MCVRTVYHTTYADGETDVSERVDCCTPGFMCANPRIQDVYRRHNYSKLHRSNTAQPTVAPQYSARPPTPRSMSPPSSRGSDNGNSHRRSGIYVNGIKYVDVNRSDRSPRRRERAVVLEPKPKRQVLHAPEPPSPRPIPIQRASTMPYGMETPPERGRRPIIVEEKAPRQAPGAVNVPPVEIVEHSSSSRRHRSTHRNPDFLTPHRIMGYGSDEDDRDRQGHRRRRRDARAQAATMAASVPTFGNTDVYGTSPYGSSYGSSNGSAFTPSPVVSPSAAVSAVKKELRWEDQIRHAQNQKISLRPKLPRASTTVIPGTAAATATGVQGEVKSILKNPSPSRPAVADDDIEELYRSVEGMKLHERESSSQRRAREAEEKDSEAYIDRLRNRFSMPPRRYTAGQGAKRRTEIWYPDEGVYKYR